jgi:ribosomal protein S27AE
MERFPRGSMPPTAFAAVATLAPHAIAPVPAVSDPTTTPDTRTPRPVPDTSTAPAGTAALDPVKHCDLSTTCPNCNAQMQPEHAHYKCGTCGYRDSCCF